MIEIQLRVESLELRVDSSGLRGELDFGAFRQGLPEAAQHLGYTLCFAVKFQVHFRVNETQFLRNIEFRHRF